MPSGPHSLPFAVQNAVPPVFGGMGSATQGKALFKGGYAEPAVLGSASLRRAK